MGDRRLPGAMTVRLSILCENSVGRPVPALGEHGFACLVETTEGTWLFDTGSGQTLLANMKILGHDPERIDGIILSHGHCDHAGGLYPLLQRIGPRPVYASPGIFARRFWQGAHERREIGLARSRSELEAIGAEFVWIEKLTHISASLVLSGPIPRRHPAETGDSHLVCTIENGKECEPDPFLDDMAAAVLTPRGLTILLGCAHAGLINTVEHLRRSLPVEEIHAVVGGTHLGPAGEAQFSATLDYLDHLRFDRLGVSHCTGLPRAAQLQARFPNKTFHANVGTTLEID